MPVIWFVSSLKFLLPLLIIRFPFQASFTNFILDSIDGDILMHYGLPYATYSTIDKTADYLTYIAMYVVGRKWKIGKTITVLFIFRSVGQLIFLVGHKDYLFYFPNLLEPLFIIYSYLIYRYDDKAHKVYKKYFILIWIFIIVFKFWNEYNVHLGHVDLSQKYFGFSN